MMLWKVKIKNIKAYVPIITPELGYMSNALIRPVVGYMNSNKTLIPLSMSAQMDMVMLID
jgi:distribution and morphology protein 31